jgi:DUF3102 family protein
MTTDLIEPTTTTTTTTTALDYAALDAETRIIVQQRTTEIKALMKRAASDIIEIGQKLIEVKARLPHGAWLPWLRSEFAWSDDTARNHMNVARAFPQIPNGSEFDARALYLLAAPSTPQSARDEAIELVGAGQPITHQAARVIVAEHKPVPAPIKVAPITDADRLQAARRGAPPDIREAGLFIALAGRGGWAIHREADGLGLNEAPIASWPAAVDWARAWIAAHAGEAPPAAVCETCGKPATSRRQIGGLLARWCADCASAAELRAVCERAEAAGAAVDYMRQRSDGKLPVAPPAGHNQHELWCDAAELARLCAAWEGAPPAPTLPDGPTPDSDDPLDIWQDIAQMLAERPDALLIAAQAAIDTILDDPTIDDRAYDNLARRIGAAQRAIEESEVVG